MEPKTFPPPPLNIKQTSPRSHTFLYRLLIPVILIASIYSIPTWAAVSASDTCYSSNVSSGGATNYVTQFGQHIGVEHNYRVGNFIYNSNTHSYSYNIAFKCTRTVSDASFVTLKSTISLDYATLSSPIGTIVHDGETYSIFPIGNHLESSLGYIFKIKFGYNQGIANFLQTVQQSSNFFAVNTATPEPTWSHDVTGKSADQYTFYSAYIINYVWLGTSPIPNGTPPSEYKISNFSLIPNLKNRFSTEKIVNGLTSQNNHIGLSTFNFISYNAPVKSNFNGTCTRCSCRTFTPVILAASVPLPHQASRILT